MQGNRTALRAVEILGVLSDNPDGLTLKEIVSALGIPKTSAYDILKALAYKQMVDEINDGAIRFKIGLRTFQIGNAYLKNADFINIAKIHVKRLAEKLNKTAFIAVLEKSDVTYLYKYEPQKAITTISNIGTKNPAHCTSLGKAILSALPMEELKEALTHLAYEKRTKYTIINEELLIDDLKTARNRGFAVDNREIENHILCIGAPIFNQEGKVIAGVSSSGIYSDELDYIKEGREVKKAGKDISQNLGYTGGYYG